MNLASIGTGGIIAGIADLLVGGAVLLLIAALKLHALLVDLHLLALDITLLLEMVDAVLLLHLLHVELLDLRFTAKRQQGILLELGLLEQGVEIPLLEIGLIAQIFGVVCTLLLLEGKFLLPQFIFFPCVFFLEVALLLHGIFGAALPGLRLLNIVLLLDLVGGLGRIQLLFARGCRRRLRGWFRGHGRCGRRLGCGRVFRRRFRARQGRHP